MVSGVSGQNVLNHVVEVRRKELAQIQHLHMEELIVWLKDTDLEMKKVATLKIALASKNNTFIHSPISLDEQNNLNNLKCYNIK